MTYILPGLIYLNIPSNSNEYRVDSSSFSSSSESTDDKESDSEDTPVANINSKKSVYYAYWLKIFSYFNISETLKI